MMAYLSALKKNGLLFEFEEKMRNIDHVAMLALQDKEKKIAQKYGNIQTTAKILKSLIIQFTKKSIKLQEELHQAAKIEDLKYQTEYHTKRLAECLKLSSDLQILVAKKKNNIKLHEEECRKLKQELILVKTQNIKKILKIEMLQHLAEKQENEQKQQQKFETFKEKINQNRAFMHTSLSYVPTTIDLLKKQKKDLSRVLWQKINTKIIIAKQLQVSYQKLKQKLVKQERKSNLDGLNGSLFFKLQENIKLSKKLGPTVSRKNKSDHKLIIYDILKQKYSNEVKNESNNQSEIKVEYEDFMKFSPIQLLGLIELKGGFPNLQKKRQFMSQSFERTIEKSMLQKGKKSKSTKKQNYLKMYILKRET